MKTLIVSTLTMFSFAFLMLATVPVMATDFEIGTQFGISHLIPEGDDSTTSITYTRLPSGTFLDIGSSPTSLYATWFPNKQFAIGPEFSFGRMSVSDEYWDEEDTESMTTLYLGGRISYFLFNHSVSSPYVLGRISHNIFSGEDSFLFDGDLSLTSFGGGLGYQWRIGSAFVLRLEAQYQRLWVSYEDEDENANEFSFIIGIGTRFGNSNANISTVPSTR